MANYPYLAALLMVGTMGVACGEEGFDEDADQELIAEEDSEEGAEQASQLRTNPCPSCHCPQGGCK